MTKVCKKVAQYFHCAVSKVFDRVKSVALWSANIRKLAKDHKGYGSAAKREVANTFLLAQGYVETIWFTRCDIIKKTTKCK
jgi:hypothetical protein